MKKNILFLFTCLIIGSLGFSQNKKADVYRGYVKFVGAPGPGSITVECSGFARKKNAKTAKDAYSEAFYTLLFRGIPGSQYELPMIPDESGKKNDPVVVALLDGGYMSFLTEGSSKSTESKVRKEDGVKGIMTTYTITINCDALRRYLEQNNVVRKFGI